MLKCMLLDKLSRFFVSAKNKLSVDTATSDADYTVISYCCAQYPAVGGVARYDYQLSLAFPKRKFFKSPKEKDKMVKYLATCKSPIVITDNHNACDIPKEVPVLLIHHGCARTTAERSPGWDPYWRDLCCNGQDQMLDYRNPANTWILSISEACTVDFLRYYGSAYSKFKRIDLLHASELEEDIYKKSFHEHPVVLGNWNHPTKGVESIEKLKEELGDFSFQQLNIQPSKNEPAKEFNRRKQAIYLDADIFLQISVSEGNSYATLDALLCGLVVVASDVGLFYQDVPEDCFVKLDWTRNKDSDYVKERLEYAWEHREELAHNARKWYLENCRFGDWERKMKEIVEDFHAAMTRKRLP